MCRPDPPSPPLQTNGAAMKPQAPNTIYFSRRQSAGAMARCRRRRSGRLRPSPYDAASRPKIIAPVEGSLIGRLGSEGNISRAGAARCSSATQHATKRSAGRTQGERRNAVLNYHARPHRDSARHCGRSSTSWPPGSTLKPSRSCKRRCELFQLDKPGGRRCRPPHRLPAAIVARREPLLRCHCRMHARAR